ncbi:MAG: hypothetical protein HWE14_01145, partial [Flavobacteriia bacterium]|nr:hypothetical protein [Flavobacteriia bacterium]
MLDQLRSNDSYSPEALKTFQIIHMALVIGVTLFAGVTIYLHVDDAFLSTDIAQDDKLIIIIPAAIACMIAGSIASERNWKQVRVDSPSMLLAAMQTSHVIKMAMHEGAALMTIVFFLLTGNYIYLIAAAV